MEAQIDDPAEEIRRLRRCVSDLVSILNLPAVWVGGQPSRIVSTLLDALMGMLRLDFVCVRLNSSAGEVPFETVRSAPSLSLTVQPKEIGEVLNRLLGYDPNNWPPSQRDSIGGIDISFVPLQIGLQGDIGVIVAGSRRADFPGQTERLVLSVAANQAAIGLQEARVLDEHRRLAQELDRRVAERTRELSQTNEELQLQVGLLQHLPVSTWTLKPDGTPDFVNQVWLEFSGQTLDFVRSHPEAWMTAIHPEDCEAASRAFWDGVRSGQDFAFETRSLRAQDGTYRWHLQQAIVLRDAEGKVLKFVGTTTDIDDWKRAENELRRTEARYRVVVETASDAVVSIDERGAIILANPAMKRVFGYNPEELIGKPLTVLMPGAMRNLHSTGFKRYLETGARHLNWQGVEMTALRANGEEFPVAVSFGEMTLDRQKIFTGFIRDISERKRSEEAIFASERKLSLIINTMPVLAWSALPDGTIEFFNQRWLDYTGLSPEQAQGWGWTEAVHRDDLGRMTQYWQAMMTTAGSGEIEARFRRFDGDYRWFLFRADAMRDESGAIIKWYGTNTDIEDWKQAQEELRKTQAELSHVTRVMTMGQLTASIAHEINQPLSGIMTNASTCLRMLDSDPPNIVGARETARRTIRDGNRASDVITRLHDLFRKKHAAAEPVDLNDATREVIALSLSDLQSNGILVQLEFAENLPAVKGDRIQIQQVILNLLRNASDAMRDVRDRPKQLLIKTDSEDSQNVRLTVRDTGIGFAPHAADRLFESFYTTKEDGIGIGLSLSRSIIEAHGGRLWVSANDGPGSSFAFSIPHDSSIGLA